MCVLLQQARASSFALDQNVLIAPTGDVAWVYQKAHPVPGEPELPGDGRGPAIDTPYGRLSNVICYDLDFPDIVHRRGKRVPTCY